jgi:hypothetical protein
VKHQTKRVWAQSDSKNTKQDSIGRLPKILAKVYGSCLIKRFDNKIGCRKSKKKLTDRIGGNGMNLAISVLCKIFYLIRGDYALLYLL